METGKGIWTCPNGHGSGSLFENVCPICEKPTIKTMLDHGKNTDGPVCFVCGNPIDQGAIHLGKGAIVHMSCQRKEF